MSTDITSDMLLTGVESLLYRRCIHAITIEDIVNVSKLAKGTFYVHFRNKDDALLALLRMKVNQMRDCLAAQENHNGGDDVIDALAHIFSAMPCLVRLLLVDSPSCFSRDDSLDSCRAILGEIDDLIAGSDHDEKNCRLDRSAENIATKRIRALLRAGVARRALQKHKRTGGMKGHSIHGGGNDGD